MVAMYCHLKKNVKHPSLIGIDCPAHILNNCIHHGAETMSMDIESTKKNTSIFFNLHSLN